MAAQPFADNVAIVTGASRGIGRELARQLAAQGARLMLAARAEDALADVAAECRRMGGEAVVLATDVTRKDQCQKLVEETVARFGRIDSLFNNAGTGALGDFEDHLDVGVFEHLISVNYLGPVYCTHYALPHIRQRRGRIVTVSSIAGRLAVPGESAYSASKFALTGFFDALRMELAGTGVSVTLIYPGYVVTAFAENSLNTEGEPHGPEARKLYTPGMTTAEECARMIVRAAARRKREVFTRRREKLSLWFKLAFPSFTDRLILGHVREKNGRLGK